MGSPCPPFKRLRGANLELLPHVNNLLGWVFFFFLSSGREELVSHPGQRTLKVLLEALIFPLMGNNSGGSIPRNVNNTPHLCDLDVLKG